MFNPRSLYSLFTLFVILLQLCSYLVYHIQTMMLRTNREIQGSQPGWCWLN
ncbi:uncharacterized protein BDZ83DRAFT_114157 [Colletotrichum acutatum]|uniref:Uncharacterized protein n=1 Tax=Glomerella acutata TaxID=27357 RepID=A0AAD8XJN8_GLOAC|nr:uncharacterized protein BDZ83DRAFT_114157 [Colletotrichum acutatum]KAK1728608.1 hypothetical protein BDZ83DRAFT_114157 [Colletotrichum acutatum]